MLKFKNFNLKLHLLALTAMLFIASAGVLCGYSSIVSAETSDASDSVIKDLNQQIEAQRAKIDKLVGQITQYKNNIKNAQGQTASLQNQILIIENTIAQTNADIEAKQEEINAVKLEIQKTEYEIILNEKEIIKDKDYLSDFIRLLNNYDDKGYLYVLLANNSFSEFFDQVKYAEGIQENIQKTVARLQETTQQLNIKKKEASEKQSKLTELLNKLEDEKAVLDGQKSQKQFLITETKKSERSFQNLVSDLKREQAASNAQIANLEEKVRKELEKKGKNEKFNSLGKAILNWPTDIKRITAYFHDPDYPYRNLFEHSGLDIGVKTGTTVRAAEAGYIAKVGLGTKWYGNYVMIIHNNNLSTLYGHLSSVNVTEDQYVSKGQAIGLSGSTGFSSGPHLHLEVRSSGIPVDPLSYLQ